MPSKKPQKKGSPEPSISLRELARIAGVSPATASMAMREGSRLARQTKDRIRELAQRHGYQPNLRLSRILTETVSSRYNNSKGLIYLIITRYTPQTWDPGNHCFLVMTERCRGLGYELEPFWLLDRGMTPSRANRIMYSRGVDGLIIHPPSYKLRNKGVLSLPIDWGKFSVVEIDDALTTPSLHHVRHDHLSGIWLALQEMENLGYRRIGFCISPDIDLTTHHRWSAGYKYWTSDRQFVHQIRHPRLPNEDPNDLRKWITENHLEAVIGPSTETLSDIESTGLRVPEDVAFVALDIKDPSSLISGENPATERSSEGIAGVSQCRSEQYLLAAEMIVSLIGRKSRGIPELPSSWIVPGKWQPGPSCPSRKKTKRH